MFSSQRPGSGLFLEEASTGAKAQHHGHAPALPCFCSSHMLSVTARHVGAVDHAEIISGEGCPLALMRRLSPCRMDASRDSG